MKLGLLTAAFPDLTLERGRRLGRRERVRDAGDRLLARRRRRAAPLRGRLAHRRRAPRRRRRAGHSRAAHARAGSRSRRSPTTRTTCIPTRPTAPRSTRISTASSTPPRCSASRSSGTFVGADPARSLTENLRSFAEVWPPMVDRARGQGRQDRDRELPDAVLGRRMAVRHEPGAHAAHLARDVQRHPRRRLRPQPRPVAPRLADDRLRARRLRLRRPHPARARQGHGDRPRRAAGARRARRRA